MRYLYENKVTGQTVVTDQQMDGEKYNLVGPWDSEKKPKKTKAAPKKEKKGFLETVFTEQ